MAAACAPFDAPELREQIENARREREQLIDTINLDRIRTSGPAAQMDEHARADVQAFKDFALAHKDELAALSFFYQQPYQRRALTIEAVQELADAIARPPLMLTTDRLWAAYARVQASQVKGVGLQRQLTDLVALLRFALGLDAELTPFADTVNQRFADWIWRHNSRRATSFTPEQTDWLRLMKEHIASSCSIARDDFDYAELAARGGLQKAWGLFGEELDGLMAGMNEELVA